MAPWSLRIKLMERLMPQPNDLSRSLADFGNVIAVARSAVGASRPLPCWGGQHQLSQTAVVCNDNQEEPSGDDYQDRVG